MRRSAEGFRAAVPAVGAALGLVLGLALAGCVPDAPVVTPAPSPSSMPVFASDEEAIAAAEEAYRAYLAASDQIGNEGGANPERIADVAAGELVTVELEGFAEFASNGWYTVGFTELKNFIPQDIQATSRYWTAYVCADVSGVDVLDARGASVVAADRPSLQAFQVELEVIGTRVFPVRVDPWSGPDVCV